MQYLRKQKIIIEFSTGSAPISAAGCCWFWNDFRFPDHFSRDFHLPKYAAPPSLLRWKVIYVSSSSLFSVPCKLLPLSLPKSSLLWITTVLSFYIMIALYQMILHNFVHNHYFFLIFLLKFRQT